MPFFFFPLKVPFDGECLLQLKSFLGRILKARAKVITKIYSNHSLCGLQSISYVGTKRAGRLMNGDDRTQIRKKHHARK